MFWERKDASVIYSEFFDREENIIFNSEEKFWRLLHDGWSYSIYHFDPFLINCDNDTPVQISENWFAYYWCFDFLYIDIAQLFARP